ncbi:EscU/YscU/HrcU family type III secretion system export apparatus switch protein [Roseicyclus sp.]|uniref:EscU/YscU/HrcU family type III secretion system export apparatus switch protein n=1 Tax=Roseicyclus sp. TaxID=1914329 RepID=UPI003F6D41A1
MASEDDDAQEKTEEPTQRRLEKAREDGQVLTSKEMFVFSTTAAGTIILLSLGVILTQWVGHWGGFFQFERGEALSDLLAARLSVAFMDFWILSLIVAVPILVVVIGTQALVGQGINFAASALAFKGNRINPLNGFKRMFSMHSLVELGKSVLKVGVIGAAAYFVIIAYLPTTLTLASMSVDRAIEIAFYALMILMGASAAILGGIGLLDYAWSSHEHLKKLRMSRQDLKEESKQNDGSPEVKARIRRLQFEASRRAAQQGRALEDVGRATAIITNPTHFAVALRYVPGEDNAPMILAMGRGRIAEEIIKRGTEAQVTVFQSPLLARALFFTGEIGQEISDLLFTPVAAVLAYIYRIDRGEDPDMPDVEIPQDLRFDQNGRPTTEGEA